MTTSDPTEGLFVDCSALWNPPYLGCAVPPTGWWCSREPGHEGPCATRPGMHPAPTPDDHDNLVAALLRKAEMFRRFDGTMNETFLLLNQAATALRTEQSARQALQQQLVNARDAWARIDRLGNLLRDRIALDEALTVPTESKEPDPRPYYDATHPKARYMMRHLVPVPEYAVFAPRSEYSQNPADYGIEAPHE